MRVATRERWRVHVTAWATSGLTCKAYAAKARVNPRTLTWWKSKLGAAAPAFVEVTAQVEPEVGMLEVVVGRTLVRVRGRRADAGARRAGGPRMIPATVRIFVCTQPHDMRCSYDTLALATQTVLGQDPRSGALFAFTNKRHHRLKVLWWDKNGYCLLSKRLHQAPFRLPVSAGSSDSSVVIDGRALAELLHGVASRRTTRVQDRS